MADLSLQINDADQRKGGEHSTAKLQMKIFPPKAQPVDVSVSQTVPMILAAMSSQVYLLHHSS